jgi:DNA-binding protein HU-beta
MNHSDLIDHIATAQEMGKADAKKLLDSIFAAIADAAGKDGEVSINGFGKFKVTDSPERDGRNPATGEAMKIKASRRFSFTPSKTLKDRLNG